MKRLVIGLFDSREGAERTVGHLVAELGLDRREIEIHAAGEGAAADTLAGLSLPVADHRSYGEALRRGGLVVSAHVDPALTDRAMDAFEACGAVDMDARETEWREEGWSGYTGHDEDIGFATYGQDAVIAPVPRRHADDLPAGALGRLEQAASDEDRALRGEDARMRARVRSYTAEP